jgi:multidrug efflux pump subunit AcrA (membrane-fusion protein)
LGPSLANCPGMTVSVDIRTGRRSVLEYIAKPV